MKAGDEIIAINEEYVAENDGGPEAMQQVLCTLGWLSLSTNSFTN